MSSSTQPSQTVSVSPSPTGNSGSFLSANSSALILAFLAIGLFAGGMIVMFAMRKYVIASRARAARWLGRDTRTGDDSPLPGLTPNGGGERRHKNFGKRPELWDMHAVKARDTSWVNMMPLSGKLSPVVVPEITGNDLPSSSIHASSRPFRVGLHNIIKRPRKRSPQAVLVTPSPETIRPSVQVAVAVAMPVQRANQSRVPMFALGLTTVPWNGGDAEIIELVEVDSATQLRAVVGDNEITFFVSVAATALVIYEHLITFEAEVQQIWRRDMTVTSILFILTRYITLANRVVVMISLSPLLSLEGTNVIGDLVTTMSSILMSRFLLNLRNRFSVSDTMTDQGEIFDTTSANVAPESIVFGTMGGSVGMVDNVALDPITDTSGEADDGAEKGSPSNMRFLFFYYFAISPQPEYAEKTFGHKDSEASSYIDQQDQGVDEFPEGGLRAWLVVLGVTCGMCATFGFVNAWGVFQAYYTENLLRGTDPSTIAWVGSVQYALVFMPGIAFGRLFDMGHLRVPVITASVLLFVATFVTAECTEFWHFILCQGIAVGLSCGTIFTAAVGTVPHWFRKKLGIALACMTLGSSVGGTVFPIILKKLIEHQGFKWTMRIMAFILLALLIVCNITIARRLPPKPKPGPFIHLGEFKNPAYSIYTLSAFVAFLGLYTCLTYIDISAVLAGVDPNFSFYLLSIANACSIIGRLGGGITADRKGPLNVMIPGTLIAGIMTYIWPYVKTKGAFIVVAVIYGIFSGVFVSLIGQPIVRMGNVEDIGMRAGMVFSIMSLGALAGPPISGAIENSTGNFKAVGIYAGSCIMASVLLLVVTRQILLRKLVGNA
ncbi:Riboflavin transporter MCH5 [Grifola frondosa]|uniref:Riboflavin transporter MCH5 n=1 Tax=Grifola frondosa TaxID=5627 RepID=A0A1C7LSZ1_GRIFR|nr:Riboflavin transporter MCH5 [Grifola frondosa]